METMMIRKFIRWLFTNNHELFDYKPDVNRIDALFERLQQEDKFDKLESELGKFNPNKLKGEEKEAWYHLHGIIPFQQGNHPLAFERFRVGVKECPDSSQLIFSLGQEHEFRGEVDQMFECFDKAIFPKVPASHALFGARYSYLWSRTDKAWSYVDPLIRVYLDLKILDTQFLHIRGLPFFEEYWAYLAAFSQLDCDFKKLSELTEKVKNECSDIDIEFFQAELEGFQTGDFSALKDKIQSSIQESTISSAFDGYNNMRLNVLLAQETDNEQDASRLLDSVSLTDKDFLWLEDIRLLAKCEQAHKYGNDALETELRKQFIARQPLLFEPSHAINFNLLKYQENLKEDYRKNKKLLNTLG